MSKVYRKCAPISRAAATWSKSEERTPIEGVIVWARTLAFEELKPPSFRAEI
jgi:hypothetical protein